MKDHLRCSFWLDRGFRGLSFAAGFLILIAFVIPAVSQSVYQTPYTFGTLSSNGLAVRVFFPQGVAVDASGNVYVAATDASTIQKISLVETNWVITTLAGQSGIVGTNDGTGTNALFGNPIGVAVDGAGNLYVADTQNGTIRQVSPLASNWVVTTIAGMPGKHGGADGTNGGARFEDPYGVALDGAGNLYVADPGTGSVRKISPIGTNWVVTTVPAPGFSQPAGVAVDGATNLFVSDEVNNTITELTPVGTNWLVTTIAGQAASPDSGLGGGSADGAGTNAQFNMPIGVAVDNADNVYVADTQNELIRKVSPAGMNWVVTTLAGRAGVQGGANGTGSNVLFNYPSGVAVDNAGNLYVADSENNVIRNGANSLSSYAVNILTGYNLIANQLNRGGNTLGEIMPVVPDGSVVYKYDNASESWSAASYSAALAEWSPADLTLNPGEGAFFESPTNFTLTFTGTPNLATPLASVPLDATYLVSAPTNEVADYESIFGTYPSEETAIYQWDAVAQDYVQNEFLFGVWTPNSVEPTFAEGDAVWISPQAGTPPAIAVAPVIVGQQPALLTVPPGNPATFTVTAQGEAPISYQWFADGIPIAGATSSSLTIPSVQTNDYATYVVAVSNPLGTAETPGTVLGNSELSVSAFPASSNCCWNFLLDQSGGKPDEITSVTATVVTPGAVIVDASGSGDASVITSSSTSASWSIGGTNGLFGNPQTVTICFNPVPPTGAVILFSAGPVNETNSVAVGTNGGCSPVVGLVTNPPSLPTCCDAKTWTLDGPFDGYEYSYFDSDYVCGGPEDAILWPSLRYGAAMVYHDQTAELITPGLLLFGGSDSKGGLKNETWMWNGKWMQTGCDPTIPARCLHAMAFDAEHQRTVLFGGLTASGLTNDTWEWNSVSEQWSPLNPSDFPSSRQGHAMAYFPDTQMIVLFGGLTASGLTNDTWIWDGQAQEWSQLAFVSSPSARQGHAMTYDPDFHAILLLGGTDTNGPEGDMWELTHGSSGYAWSEVFPSAVPPRTGHAVAYDPACAQIVVFGGFDTNGYPLNDTWVFDEGPQTWSQPVGQAPLAAGALAAAYYPPDKSLATLGGNAVRSSTINFATNPSSFAANGLTEFFYNPNLLFDGICSNYPLCPNIITGPLWARTLFTAQASFRDNGDWFNDEGQHAFSYTSCVASDQYNTLSGGGYPSANLDAQQYSQPKAGSTCTDNFSDPQFSCTNFSLPESPQCAWSFPVCQLYADYALNGNFCPDLNLNISVYDYPWGRDTLHIGTIYADGQTAHYADSVFPGPCGGVDPYDEYLEYSDSQTGSYLLSNTRGPNDKLDLRWHMSQVGIGAAIGEQSPCVTESGGDPCLLAYFEFDQVFGNELYLKARVAGPDLRNGSTLSSEGGVRDFLFYVDADNDTNTGDQCCFEKGADFYVLIEQTPGSQGTVVTSGYIYQWNACLPNTNGCAVTGAWQPEPVYFRQATILSAGITELTAVVPMAAVGNPQGCYSVWAVSSTPNDASGCPLNSLPNNPSPCECRMVLPRISDVNCPYVVGVDTSKVTGQMNLSAPVVVTFNKPMSIIDSSQVIVSPFQAVNTYLIAFDDQTLDIRPASGTWTSGCYTVTLLDTIRDASGNTMCSTYTFNLCVPDTNFYVADQNGDPTNFFNQGDNIYVRGCGFVPNSLVTLYLVTSPDVNNSGSLLADWTTTGPKQVSIGADGCLPSPTLVGMASAPLGYKVVADINGDGVYETNLDRVTDLCGLGTLYGQPCTNMIENNIVAWWPFNEASVDGPVNEIINANNGVVVGPYTTLVPGEIGQARTFNTNLPPSQSPTYIDVPNSLDFAGLLNFSASDFSIELWLNTTETNEAPIVDKRQFPNPLSSAFSGYYFYLANGAPMLQLGDGASVTTFTSTAPSAATGTWSDVIVSVDQENLLVTMSVNGNSYIARPSIPYTAPIQTDPAGNNPADIWMAASHANPGGAPYFVGAMDELTMYSVALSQAQSAYIFDQGTNGKCAEGVAMITNQLTATPTYVGQWTEVAISIPYSILPISPVSYQWYANGIPMYDGPDVIGATSNVLSILITNILQFTNVSVRISNVFGYTYSSVVPITIPPLTASKAVLPVSGVWKYLANGSEPAANWNQPGFDDSAWPGGPGLFGTAPTNIWPYPFQTAIQPPALGGPITVYYRAPFQWVGATNDVNIVSTNFIQDGAVFYLNGVEVGRLRVPPNQNSLTLALPQPNPGQPETIAFPAGSLLPGTNLLAVEVHQSSASSAQDVFGIGLTASVSVGALPSLAVTRSATNISLSWTGPGTLQTTPSLDLPWSNLPAASLYTAPVTNASQFYKLQVP